MKKRWTPSCSEPWTPQLSMPQAAFAQHHRDVNRFVLRPVLDADVDAAFIRFGNDIDIGRRPAAVELAVRADIVSAFGDRVQVRDFFNKMSLDRV